MKIILVIIVLTIFKFNAIAQQDNKEKVIIYNPVSDAKEEISKAVLQGRKENKNILIQIGGNWCPWCIKFYKLIHSDFKLDSMISANYVYMLVNYSKENKNSDVLKELGNPQRFGFPVLVVLDNTGKRIHTQDSGLLELDKGYDPKKVMEFLTGWTVKASNVD